MLQPHGLLQHNFGCCHKNFKNFDFFVEPLIPQQRHGYGAGIGLVQVKVGNGNIAV